MATACALRELPLAMCAILDDEPTPVRRSGKIRQPPVRLRDSDYPNTHRIRPGRGEGNNLPKRRTPVPVDALPPQPNQVASKPVTVLPKGNDTNSSAARPTTALSSAAAEVDDVLFAEGEITSSSTTVKVPAETSSAIERALKALTEASLLISQQKSDPFLKQTRNSLVGKKTRPGNDQYLTNEKQLVWYTLDK